MIVDERLALIGDWVDYLECFLDKYRIYKIYIIVCKFCKFNSNNNIRIIVAAYVLLLWGVYFCGVFLYVYVVDAIRFLNKPCNCTELNFGIRNNAAAICKIDLLGPSDHLVKLLLGW